MASIFIGASGAMMDLAVDITSAVYEVISKKPDILPAEAVLSGLRVGRAAMGTMTTTLLLAYSGGYISLLMVFMAQGTPIDHILNYKYVAAEVLDTVVGSFGLVTVAPFTALMAGLLLTRKKAACHLNFCFSCPSKHKLCVPSGQLIRPTNLLCDTCKYVTILITVQQVSAFHCADRKKVIQEC